MEILKYIQVIVSVLLILVVLLQTPASTLNLSTMSNGVSGVNKKRWAEKVLFIATITLAIAFVINSTVLFVLG